MDAVTSVGTEWTTTRRYAGFWIRTAAYLVDQLALALVSQILGYAALLALYVAARIAQSPPPASFGTAFSGGMTQVVMIIASLAVSFPYTILFHHYRGGTPGKLLLGFIVIDERTGKYLSIAQATGRYFASFVSAILVGAGYLMVAMNREKRALHDVLAGTVSVFRPELRKEKPAEEAPSPN